MRLANQLHLDFIPLQALTTLAQLAHHGKWYLTGYVAYSQAITILY